MSDDVSSAALLPLTHLVRPSLMHARRRPSSQLPPFDSGKSFTAEDDDDDVDEDGIEIAVRGENGQKRVAKQSKVLIRQINIKVVEGFQLAMYVWCTTIKTELGYSLNQLKKRRKRRRKAQNRKTREGFQSREMRYDDVESGSHSVYFNFSRMHFIFKFEVFLAAVKLDFRSSP